MPSLPSPTAAAATAAAAAQLARRRSVGSAAVAAPPSYSLSGQAFCTMMASADLDGEVRELLAEAKAWYKKKGGALPLQVRCAWGFGFLSSGWMVVKRTEMGNRLVVLNQCCCCCCCRCMNGCQSTATRHQPTCTHTYTHRAQTNEVLKLAC